MRQRKLQIPTPAPPPDVLLKLETHDILTRAIESLPPKQRLVVLLYYYDELTMREIGQILGINGSRVSNSIRRYAHPEGQAKGHI